MALGAPGADNHFLSDYLGGARGAVQGQLRQSHHTELGR